MSLYNQPWRTERTPDAIEEDTDAELGQAYDEIAERSSTDVPLPLLVDAAARVARSWESEAEAIRAEEQRLAARRRGLETHREHLLAWLRTLLMSRGEARVRTALFTVSLCDSPAKVTVLDEGLVPDDCWRTRREIDKGALLDRLKRGEAIPGAEITRGQHVRIK